MMLEGNRLQKEYITDGKRFFAVRDASFEVNAGDFICLIGQSGSGKSTLLGMAAGLLRPDGGSLRVNEVPIFELPDNERAKMRGSIIGYVPQGQSLLHTLTVIENIRTPLFFGGRSESKENGEYAAALLKETGLKNRANSYPSELSGGEMKRVAVARALCAHPSLILADEPTADIDDENTQMIMRLLQRTAQEGAAVICATHELQNIAYANRVFKMTKGNLTEESIDAYQERAARIAELLA